MIYGYSFFSPFLSKIFCMYELDTMKNNKTVTSLQTLPHSIEAEQSLLGALMLDNNGWDVIGDKLRIDDFYHQTHKQIFKCISVLASEVKPFDPLTVSEEFKRNNVLKEIDIDNYLAKLAENIPSVTNIQAYTDIVYEKAILRRLFSLSQIIGQSAYYPEGRKYTDILEEAERSIFKLTEQKNYDNGPIAIKPLLKSTLNRIDELFNSKELLTGISSGFQDLDEITSGLQPSDMIVVAARPSMGKTILGMNFVENAIMSNPKKAVVVFSLEMPSQHILMRTLSSLGKINQTRIRTGKLQDSDWPKLASAVKTFREKKSIYR